MNKLWTFGCSTIAGSELGSGITQQELTRWLIDNTSFKNMREFLNVYSNDYIKEEQVYHAWQLFTNDAHSPELSYGGQLAKALNLELKNCAVPGCGIDRVLHQLVTKKESIDWENDIVIAELTPIYRYMSDETIYNRNCQLALMTKNINILPSTKTLEYMYTGVLNIIKKDFPLVKIIDSGQVLETRIYSDYISNNGIFMNDIAYRNITNLEHVQYPGGHFVEEIHKQFADNLLDIIEWKIS